MVPPYLAYHSDSYALALSGEIDDLVKPELKDEYATVKYDWFLTDNSAEQQRCPGKVCDINVSSYLIFI